METQGTGFIDCVEKRLVIVQTPVQAEAPQAVCTSSCFVGFCLVLLIVSFDSVNNANAHFGDQVINGIQSVAVTLLLFQR